MRDHVFMLPDLGEGLTEAEIVEWKVEVGDTVCIDHVVVEVETAKAVVEVPIPFEGTVVTLHGNEGTVLKVGTPLITVSDGQVGDVTAINPPHSEDHPVSGSVLIGYGTTREPRKRRRRVESSPRAASLSIGNFAAPAPDRALTTTYADNSPVISPVVRNLARELGIELSDVDATGAGGIIRRIDLESAITSASADPGAELVPIAGDVRLPLKGTRKAVADKLVMSRREIPDATTWVDVDATGLVQARQAINSWIQGGQRISLLAILARLTIAALQKFPQLNSTVDTKSNEIIQFGRINLGIATQAPRGLIVPVIEGANKLTSTELAKQLKDTIEMARAGKLSPARLTGGTFTLNNYGMFGVDGSSAIINYPESAILGFGRIIDKPWVVDGQLVIRKITQIALTFDHRVCDGATAAGFLRLVGDYIENPIAALGEMELD